MNRRDNKERGGNGGETHRRCRRFNFDLWISFCTLGDVIFVWLRLRLFRLSSYYVYYRTELSRFIGVAILFKCLTSGRGLDRTAAGKGGGKCYWIFLQTGVRWRFQSNSEIGQQPFLSIHVQSRMLQMKQVHARIPPAFAISSGV